MKSRVSKSFVLGMMLLPTLGFAAHVSQVKPIAVKSIQVSRYQTAKVAPKFKQQELLDQTIQVHFPDSVKTVGQALEMVLQGSGYHIDPSMHKVMQVAGRFKQPLPAIDRDLGPVTLKQAVKTLMGKPFTVGQDVLKRTVLFQAEQTLKKLESKKSKQLKADQHVQKNR